MRTPLAIGAAVSSVLAVGCGGDASGNGSESDADADSQVFDVDAGGDASSDHNDGSQPDATPEDLTDRYAIDDRTEGWTSTEILADVECTFPSLAFDSAGNKFVAFAEDDDSSGTQTLGLASYISESWSRETLDDAAGRIEGTTITTDSEDGLYVAYGRIVNAEPKVAYQVGGVWTRDVVGIGSVHGTFPIIYLGEEDTPYVFYTGAPSAEREYYSDLYRARLDGSSWLSTSMGDEGTSVNLAIDQTGNCYVGGVSWDFPYALSIYTDATRSLDKTSGGNAGELWDIGFDSSNTMVIAYWVENKLWLRNPEDSEARELLEYDAVSGVFVDEFSEPLRVYFSISDDGLYVGDNGIYIIEVGEEELTYYKIASGFVFGWWGVANPQGWAPSMLKANGKLHFVQCSRDGLHLFEEK